VKKCASGDWPTTRATTNQLENEMNDSKNATILIGTQLAERMAQIDRQAREAEARRIAEEAARPAQVEVDRAAAERAAADSALERVRAATPLLLEALQGFMAIVNESRGVSEYHLNGAVAEWDEFTEIFAAAAAIAAATN
jgi:hypothetical protein